MNAYNDAQRSYLKNDYLNAAFGFGLMFERYPDFFLNDKSLFRIGASLMHLGLYDAADSVFKLGYSMHDTTFDSAMPHFGRINVAIEKNRLDSLKILIQDFRQQFPQHRLNGLVSMYDAIAHIRMADTAYAESIFVSLLKEQSDLQASQVSLFYLSRLSLQRDNKKMTLDYLHKAIKIIRDAGHTDADNLVYLEIFPVAVHDHQIVFKFYNDIEAPYDTTKKTVRNQYDLLQLIFKHPAPGDFAEEKKVLLNKLGLDTMNNKGITFKSINEKVANINSVCHQLDSKH